MKFETSDHEIRQAFHKKYLKKHHENKEHLIIDELGLMHGISRIDIAMISRYLHGYEIKSSKDNLSRLPRQVESYKFFFQKLTFIIAPKYEDEIEKLVPKWCGIIRADKGPKGGIHFSTKRRAQKNPDFMVYHAAHLLWKKEAIDLIEFTRGKHKNLNNLSRKDLYKLIEEDISENQLVQKIKEYISKREVGRFDQLQMLYDDL